MIKINMSVVLSSIFLGWKLIFAMYHKIFGILGYDYSTPARPHKS